MPAPTGAAPFASPPLDDEGKPMAMVSYQMAELVNLGNYSSATLGPMVVSRWAKDTPEERQRVHAECARECEDLLRVQRGPILEFLRRSKEGLTTS